MARPFDVGEAKKLLESHGKLLDGLTKAKKSMEALEAAVVKAAENMVTEALPQVLQDIPVEELNRDKRGIRIKLLQDEGYETIEDIRKASVYSLGAINGISDEGAESIKAAADQIAQTARQGVKIRLSEDDKSAAATQLVLAVYKYKNSESAGKEAVGLHKTYGKKVQTAMGDLKAGAGSLKWLFCSKEKKEKAARAYETLHALSRETYFTRAQNCLKALDKSRIATGAQAWKDFAQDSIRYFNILEELVPGVMGADDTLYGLPEELALSIQNQPLNLEGLSCQLRRYQEWGVKYALHQKRALLGDEMGLGKTVQAIAAMVALKNTGATHFAVVCPASVLTNWCREIQKMSNLSVTKIHGADREAALGEWERKGGVAVTNYETTGHFQLAEGRKLSLLVVDEAHYIKNPGAQRTKNVLRISQQAEALLFMTGTALENKVEEMIALMKILRPEVADSVRGMEFMATAPKFRAKVAPVYYRRKREDVLTELPELIESREWCELNAVEEVAYEEAVLKGSFPAARRVSWNVENLQDSSKAARMLELIEEAEEDGRKIIVFSFFLDTIRKITEVLGDRCYGPINGSIDPQKRQEIIDSFDKAPAGSVLVAQIQAGGTGLNIQSASVVILCEPQFKPSIENQAISRAYRMGQTRNVLVYRLLCEDTVDEKITSLLESKQAIFDAFADESAVAEESRELDEKTFGSIMQEEAQRIQAKREDDSQEKA